MHFIYSFIYFSGVYEKAATKGRQALLRFRANQIANYEALYPIHFPPIERDPKYIYYVGQSKTFETWYEDRKDDCAIFKDFEKKSTFEEFVFNEKNYDKFSIWDYDVDIENEIEKFKTMKNSLNDNIENLIKIFEDQKNDDNDANNIDINEKIKNLNDNIDNLIKNLVRKCNKNNLNDNIDELIKNLEDQKSDNDVNNNIEINKKIEILKAIKY